MRYRYYLKAAKETGNVDAGARREECDRELCRWTGFYSKYRSEEYLRSTYTVHTLFFILEYRAGRKRSSFHQDYVLQRKKEVKTSLLRQGREHRHASD